MNLLAIIVCLVSASASGQDIRLADPEIQRRWEESREHKLEKIFLLDGKFVPVTRNVAQNPDRDSQGRIRASNGGATFPWALPGGRRVDLTEKRVWPPDLKAKPGTAVYGTLRATLEQAQGGKKTWTDGERKRPAWKWPVGATFFEMHYHASGHPFELRMLHKHSEEYGFDSYDTAIFRPFSSEEELEWVIGERIQATQVRRTIRSVHKLKQFAATDTVHLYDDLDVDWDNLVRSVTWEDNSDHQWHHAGKGDGWLTPRGYSGFITGSSHDSCAKCHHDAGAPVMRFDPEREWYGFIPGADGIFRFDPVDRSSVKRLAAGSGWVWKDN